MKSHSSFWPVGTYKKAHRHGPGIHVVIFRGTERNKRRGFHNLHIFNHRLQEKLATVA